MVKTRDTNNGGDDGSYTLCGSSPLSRLSGWGQGLAAGAICLSPDIPAKKFPMTVCTCHTSVRCSSRFLGCLFGLNAVLCLWVWGVAGSDSDSTVSSGNDNMKSLEVSVDILWTLSSAAPWSL